MKSQSKNLYSMQSALQVFINNYIYLIFNPVWQIISIYLERKLELAWIANEGCENDLYSFGQKFYIRLILIFPLICITVL